MSVQPAVIVTVTLNSGLILSQSGAAGFCIKKVMHMRSPFCAPPPVAFGTIGRFYEIEQGLHAIEGYPAVILFNFVPLCIPKW
jgi:hypothetical protein